MRLKNYVLNNTEPAECTVQLLHGEPFRRWILNTRGQWKTFRCGFPFCNFYCMVSTKIHLIQLESIGRSSPEIRATSIPLTTLFPVLHCGLETRGIIWNLLVVISPYVQQRGMRLTTMPAGPCKLLLALLVTTLTIMIIMGRSRTYSLEDSNYASLSFPRL